MSDPINIPIDFQPQRMEWVKGDKGINPKRKAQNCIRCKGVGLLVNGSSAGICSMCEGLGVIYTDVRI